MDDEQKKSPTNPAASDGRKPYCKPGVTSESIYEVSALACGKTPGGGTGCTGSTGSVHNS